MQMSFKTSGGGSLAETVLCPRCRRYFVREQKDQELCLMCVSAEEEAALAKLRAFAKANPGANIGKLVSGTGIPLVTVIKMTQSGRLKVEEITQSMSNCIRCGRPTSRSTMCDECRQKLRSELTVQQASSGTSPGQVGDVLSRIRPTSPMTGIPPRLGKQ